VQSFIRELAPQRLLALQESDLKKLLDHDWPGNIRELRNVVEMAIIHSGSSHELHLPTLMTDAVSRESPSLEMAMDGEMLTLAEMEKRYAAFVAKKLNYNLTRTAKALGISLNTLKKKLPRRR